MNQAERREYLLRYLLNENRLYADVEMPSAPGQQRQLLRGLMNVRIVGEASPEFLETQDMYSAGFYPFPDEESFWGCWSKHAR